MSDTLHLVHYISCDLNIPIKIQNIFSSVFLQLYEITLTEAQ